MRDAHRTPRHLLRLLALLLFLAGSVESCCTCRETARCSPGDDVPYAISITSGGGFSGRHSGYIFSSDGKIWRTSGSPRSEDERDLLDSLRRDQICLLRQFMESQKIDTLNQKETGNMTTTLSFQKGETVLYTLSWNGTLGEQDLVPTALIPTMKRIQALLKSAGK